MMYLPFKNRFKISLHFTSRNFHPDRQGQGTAGFNSINIRTNNVNVTIINLIDFNGCYKFKCRGYISPEFNMRIGLANSFTFKSRTVGNRNGYLRNFNLATTNFERFLNDVFVGNIRNDMLISTYTRWEYFRYRRVCYHRKAIINSTGSHRIFIRRYFTECQYKSENSILRVS